MRVKLVEISSDETGIRQQTNTLLFVNGIHVMTRNNKEGTNFNPTYSLDFLEQQRKYGRTMSGREAEGFIDISRGKLGDWPQYARAHGDKALWDRIIQEGQTWAKENPLYAWVYERFLFNFLHGPKTS